MSVFRLLIVEDDEQDLAVCKDSIKRFMDEKQCEIEHVECKNVEDAENKLLNDNSFDGAIIDLKLYDEDDGGNRVIEYMNRNNLRIPTAILTGTPGNAVQNHSYIGVFKKGEPDAQYYDLIKKIWGIYNTGLTRIMGGRGIIQELLTEVFRNCLEPEEYRKKWVEYGEKDSTRTENALLRHVLNHLIQRLDINFEESYPEEVYITPTLDDRFKTGSIVRDHDNNKYFIVITPACDLILTDGTNIRTDRIQIVEIEDISSILRNVTRNCSGDEIKDKELSVYKNKHALYYHCLPKTDYFEGGVINFRKVSSYKISELRKAFNSPEIQISSSFIKDVVARFSSYYARQGQPNIE